MPDKNGWHEAFLADGRMYRWHFCASSDTDTLVLDTVEARKLHERECNAVARAAKKKAQREIERKRLANLALARQEKKLTNDTIGRR